MKETTTHASTPEGPASTTPRRRRVIAAQGLAARGRACTGLAIALGLASVIVAVAGPSHGNGHVAQVSPPGASAPEPGWVSGFDIRGPDDKVSAIAVFDDGSGPALYAGGSFNRADGAEVAHIARWDGTTWSEVTGFSELVNRGAVRALGSYDLGDGAQLYVGGKLLNSPGESTWWSVARWDGTAWSPLIGPAGAGTNGAVNAMAKFDDGGGEQLYVGGDVIAAGGVTTYRVARWDGDDWSALEATPSGQGVDGSVYALAMFDDGTGPALYAAGWLSSGGGVPLGNIGRWDGASWHALEGPLGNGTDGTITSVAVYDDGSGPSLYAGGNFSIAGGLTARNVARWDGHAWWPLADSLGNGTDAEVATLAVYDDGSGPALYVAGDFNWAGGQYAASIARWDGSAWSPVSSFPQYYDIGWILSLAAHDDGSGPALYAAGFFDFIGGIDAYSIARWDGVSWSGVGGLRPFGGMPVMEALVSYDAGGGPVLVAAGDFNTAGGRTAHGLAQWDGTEWWPVVGPNGVGTDGGVRSLAVVTDGARPILVAGGVFEHAGGVETHNIARWDGDRWSGLAGPLATGTDGWVETIAGFDDGTSMNIFAGGLFGSAGGLASARIGQWTSSSGALFADDFESGGPSAWSVIVDGRNGSDRADIDARQVGVAALPASSARVSRGRQ
jgi:hypothetical protein